MAIKNLFSKILPTSMAQGSIDPSKVNELVEEVSLNVNISRHLEESDKGKDPLKFIKELYYPIDVKKAVLDKMVSDKLITLNKDKSKYKDKLKKVSDHNVTRWFSIFSGSIRKISINFGFGIRSYFVFLKFLFLLNLLASLISIIFIFLPDTILYSNYDPYTANITGNETAAFNLSRTCSSRYVVNVTYDTVSLLQDFIQGTGWLEQSGLFYGYYKGINSDLSSVLGINFKYDLSIAYFITLSTYFLISLIFISQSVNYSFKSIIIEKSNQIGQNVFSGFIYGGKDLIQTNESVNANLKKMIVQDILTTLNASKDKLRRRSRSICQKIVLYFKRIFFNLLIIGLLGCSGYAIYYVYSYSLYVTSTGNYYFDNSQFKLFINYAPSLTLIVLNIVIPMVVEMVVIWEDYMARTELNVVLMRTIVIKLASFSILIYTLFTQVTCQPKDSCYISTGSCSSIPCWETYVAKELYKLLIMDFIVSSFVTIVVEPLRRCCCGRLIGAPQFSILKNVLDLIYNQTIAWIGACFSPLFAVICAIKYFITFYLKLMSIYYVTIPQNKAYLSTNITGLFLKFLLGMYLILSIPITYIMFSQTTSKACGPFREYSTMFESLTTRLESLNHDFFYFLNFSVSTSIVLFVLMILLLVLVYYVNVAKSMGIINRKLKETLIKENQTKRILLMTKSA